MPNLPSAQTGTTTVEYVGLATAVALFLAAAAVAIGPSGQEVGAGVGRHVRAIVDAPVQRAKGITRRRGPAKVAASGEAPTAWSVDGSTTKTVQGSTGIDPPQLGPDGILPGSASAGKRPQGIPELSGWAWKQGSRKAGGGRVAWCAVCAGAGFAFAPVAGTEGSADAASFGSKPTTAQSSSGPGARVDAQAGIALAAVQLQAQLRRSTGWGSTSFDARLDALAGARGSAYADARFTRNTQAVDAGVDALAGAAVRAQERGSLTILGITLSQSGGLEGWAGAGLRGRAQVERSGGKVTLGTSGGLAWGLGGAADIQVSVDATSLITDPYRSLYPLLRLTGQATPNRKRTTS